MSFAAYAPPVVKATPSARADYFRKVGMLTFAGLGTAAVTSVFASAVILSVPILTSRFVMLAVVFGCFFMANSVMHGLVYSAALPTKLLGFFGAAIFEGVAMGYLLLAAAAAGQETFGNPLVFLVEAAALVGLTALGMLIYLWSGPQKLDMIKSGMAIAALPMLGLMAVTWVFPIGGFFGLLASVAFVLMSVGGLLYNLNEVIHKLPTSMSIEGSYSVTMGLLVLFWNLVTLIMKLQRR